MCWLGKKGKMEGRKVFIGKGIEWKKGRVEGYIEKGRHAWVEERGKNRYIGERETKERGKDGWEGERKQGGEGVSRGRETKEDGRLQREANTKIYKKNV